MSGLLSCSIPDLTSVPIWAQVGVHRLSVRVTERLDPRSVAHKNGNVIRRQSSRVEQSSCDLEYMRGGVEGMLGDTIVDRGPGELLLRLCTNGGHCIRDQEGEVASARDSRGGPLSWADLLGVGRLVRSLVLGRHCS